MFLCIESLTLLGAYRGAGKPACTDSGWYLFPSLWLVVRHWSVKIGHAELSAPGKQADMINQRFCSHPSRADC